ncbi:hydroxymethylglutaryl-CoA lyase [Roseovarius amoyensis]|uniref:hydroxymethylglutaryl-CoA lyase n=1 Tax=Roseovarius amoyensis TaxID=2211448 RepID=UPI000DBE6CD9|nr:hydroxymethylglutaryl-CoA lyase [Roseovarius amoyensis]
MRDSCPDLVDVGPRDGLQGIGPFVPTTQKIAMIEGLAAAGLRRIEIGSFASPRALPQLADIREVLAAARAIPGLDPQVLVPNEKYGLLALEAGVDFVAFVISVSAAHSRSNVRCTPEEAAEEYAGLIAAAGPDTRIRLNLATAFDCPFDGRVPQAAVLALLDRLVPLRPDVEICLCDTTGRGVPDQVEALFRAAIARFPQVANWGVHTHDTYGLGLANAWAAVGAGASVIDSAVGGLGGCPFAPGATGNVATEDVVWMLERMGYRTGVDLGQLLQCAHAAAALDGACSGGRVRNAIGG